MLEIYLNPDGNILLIDLDSPLNPLKLKDGLVSFRTDDLNLQAINFLLKELRIRRDDEQIKVYETYYNLINKDNKGIEKSIVELQDILNNNQENLSAWVALAMANFVMHRTNEAKANLKIMEKSNFNIRYTNDYERGMMLNAYMTLLTDNIKKGEEILVKIITDVNVSQGNLTDSF